MELGHANGVRAQGGKDVNGNGEVKRSEFDRVDGPDDPENPMDVGLVAAFKAGYMN